jgi:hypothetical protein
VENVPIILEDLHDFLRLKERKPKLKICHNWGDIIPYLVSTVIRVSSFQGTPHIFPYNVPPRLGLAEVLWQIGCIQDDNLTGKGKGTFFPDFIVIYNFVIAKDGWTYFEKYFEVYHLKTSPNKQYDPKGFFTLFRTRIKGAKLVHQMNFPEDLIRNEFNLEVQELNKEMWVAYDKLLTIVHKMDPKYDPLIDFNLHHKNIDFLLLNFKEIMGMMNTKRVNLEVDLGTKEQTAKKIEERLAQ